MTRWRAAHYANAHIALRRSEWSVCAHGCLAVAILASGREAIRMVLHVCHCTERLTAGLLTLASHCWPFTAFLWHCWPFRVVCYIVCYITTKTISLHRSALDRSFHHMAIRLTRHCNIGIEIFGMEIFGMEIFGMEIFGMEIFGIATFWNEELCIPNI